MLLTDDQVQFIEWDLKQQGLYYQPLREELLDHICCAVEKAMENGSPFNQAYRQVTDRFGEEGVLKVQSQTIHLLTHKQLIMKRLVAAASALVACILLVTITNAQNMPSMHPIDERAKVTSTFGERVHPFTKQLKHHSGIDFAVPVGTPIRATADGLVLVAVEQQTGHGNHIVLQHDEEYSSMYANLNSFLVREGDRVKKGDIIAYSGNSGASTAPHLHYEVLKDGKAVDPESYY